MHRMVTAAVVMVVLIGSGAWLNQFVSPAPRGLRLGEFGLERETPSYAPHHVVTFAILGGLRTVAADLAWLRMHTLWERGDWIKCDTLLRLVPAIDPEPLYFWLNGARIIANDFPAWRIAAGGGDQVMPARVQSRIRREQADAALAFLVTAMKRHPASSELWLERASIELHRLGDLAAAAESYRRAWEMPNGPYYAARLHAQLLHRSGRTGEALAWLRRIHPSLPRDDNAAEAELVLSRIRDLERQLAVPLEKSYPAGL